MMYPCARRILSAIPDAFTGGASYRGEPIARLPPDRRVCYYSSFLRQSLSAVAREAHCRDNRDLGATGLLIARKACLHATLRADLQNSGAAGIRIVTEHPEDLATAELNAYAKRRAGNIDRRSRLQIHALRITLLINYDADRNRAGYLLADGDADGLADARTQLSAGDGRRCEHYCAKDKKGGDASEAVG